MKTKEISNMESQELLLELEIGILSAPWQQSLATEPLRAARDGGKQVDVCRCMVTKPHFKDYFDCFGGLGGAFLSPSTWDPPSHTFQAARQPLGEELVVFPAVGVCRL